MGLTVPIAASPKRQSRHRTNDRSCLRDLHHILIHVDTGVPSGVVRLVIVDDHPAARQGLRLRLGREADLRIVGEAATARDALTEVERLNPDVVVVDLALPDGDGIQLVQHLCSVLPRLRGVILTLHDAPSHRQRARQVGVGAFVGKHEPTQALLEAIRFAGPREE